MSIHRDGIRFIEKKIKDEIGLNVKDLDFTSLEDGVWGIDNNGTSYLITNNSDLMNLFKAYEDLIYGEIS